MSKYEFKYRLSQKSSFAQIVKAARACNFDISVNWNIIHFTSNEDGNYFGSDIPLEDVPEWLNMQLEDRELLKPFEPEP